MENKKAKKVSKLELEILELESRLAPDGGKGEEPLACAGGDENCPQGAEC